jgi:tetratricopeptide (TPR) repeat protein
MKTGWVSLAAVCALVLGVYTYMAQSGVLEMQSPTAADAYYNLLVQGFRAGQLSLNKVVPPEFAQLADPYDPAANLPYQAAHHMLDLSYYKGRLYLYFGVTPALMLFWPYAALTGRYFFQWQAVAVFCALGFLASAGLLYALWRCYLPEVSVWVVSACVLALGLATGVPGLLAQSDVYGVPISCGYMLTMLALAAIWRALQEPKRRCRWLALASTTYGLAVGARPSLLFGAAILMVPIAQTWRDRRPLWAALLAATGPILLIGLGLMLYNARRFDNPFEFGWHYELAGQRQVTQHNFSLPYLWFNFRVYFLEPVRWSVQFPFVRGTLVPPAPPGYTQVRNPFGVLTNIPLVWLALAAPVAWRSQSGQAVSGLRWFMTAVALLFGTSALTLGFYCGSSFRYEVDFLPSLLLLAVVGIFGVERRLADRSTRRRAARWGWGLLLVFSVVFNLLASVVYYAETHNILGLALLRLDKLQEAAGQFEQALRLKPDYADAHNNLGVAAGRLGRLPEAIGQFEQAVGFNPDNAEAHNNLGFALQQTDKIVEAITHYEQAVRIRPDYAEAHNNLGNALEQTGKLREAVVHYQQALRIKPDYSDARNALARLQSGQ